MDLPVGFFFQSKTRVVGSDPLIEDLNTVSPFYPVTYTCATSPPSKMVNCLCAFLYKIFPAGRRPKPPPPSPSLPATEPTRPLESRSPSSNMAETRLFQRTSSLVSESRFEYDVFLSFRGEDTRHGFTKHIYEKLVRMGVRTFFDNEELQTGDKIGDRLFNAIKGSEIFVPIFSVRYADSRWCLMELADIVKCNRLIIPVFVHVNPVDVQKQEGTYGSPLPGFMDRFGAEKVNEWKEALRVAGNAPGFTLDDDRSEVLLHVFYRTMPPSTYLDKLGYFLLS